MLTEVCQYLRNYFDRERIFGKFLVSNGEIKTSEGVALPILEGQYFRVVGSIFNDGVHKYGDLTDILKDEPEFAGAVWTMAIPPQFLELVADIEKWVADNGTAINSPYQSESFGGYSYSLRSGTSQGGESGTTGGVSWEGQFSARLNPWRKI